MVPSGNGTGPARRSCPPTPQRILFVDDEAHVRRAFARTVSTHGLDVDLARSGPEAVEMAGRTPYPVIATDLSMPGMDGVSLIRALHLKNPTTIFVVVTGRDDVAIPTEPQLRHNVASILTKPWDVEELIETLQRSLRLWQSRSSRPSEVTRAQGSPERILLLEDEDADAALLAALLSSSGHGGTLTRSKRLGEALDLLDRERFGIIISDLSLPDARGLDAVLRIQNVASHTPLIVLSGLTDDALALQAVQAGAQDVLVKDRVDATALLRSIRYAHERKRAELDLARLAHFDPLTELPNRGYFRERLGHALTRARRSGVPLAVLFVDLDDFKPVNDMHGHAAGDSLLVAIGGRLQDTVRDGDIVARLGGDEFAVVLADLSGLDEAISVAERMLGAIAAPHRLGDDEARVTASIGVAVHPAAGETAEELLKAADHAMYAAKRRGRNTVQVAGAERRATRGSPPGLQAEVGRALRRDELVLGYLPRHGVAARRIVGAEAELAFRLGGQRTVGARELLARLGGDAAAMDVARWAVRSICRDVAVWRRGGAHESYAALPWAPALLTDGGLLGAVLEALGAFELPGSAIELALSEEALAELTEPAVQTLTALRSHGVRLAVDGFGAGPASLRALGQLPVTTVALAPSLVASLESTPTAAAIVRGIVAVARRLDLTVVAAGVSTARDRSRLEAEGCDVLQGKLLGGPMSAEQLADRIRGPLAPAGRSTMALLPPARPGGASRDLGAKEGA